MTATETILASRPLLLLRDGGSLREGVARRHGRRWNWARTTPRTTPTNTAHKHPQAWCDKPRPLYQRFRYTAVEAAREPGVVARPWDRRDDHLVHLALHARRVGLHVAQRGPEIQRPPAPAPLAEVIPRAAPATVRATIPLAVTRADRHHDRAV